MGKIYQGIEELVGHTPLVNFRRLAKAEGVNAEILAKLECFNPAGSAKDRVGLQMVLDAEKAGILKRGSVIIEPTSGNTGVGLAAVAAARGYKTVIVMPDSMSEERRMLLKAHGAELVLTDGKKGMQGAIEKAEELQKTTDNSWLAGQFTNPSNPDAHYHSTGPEIWEDTDGKVDICCNSGYRGDDYRDGPLSERDESVRLCGGGGTRRLTGSFRGRSGTARHSGYRRRLHTGNTRYGNLRRNYYGKGRRRLPARKSCGP